MSLKKQERSLKMKVEKIGLEREIKHTRFDNPIDFEYGGKIYRDTKAVTFVMLVAKDTNEALIEDFRDIAGDSDVERVRQSKGKYYREGDGHRGLGVAICSDDDQFNKRLGRVIATGRALKDKNGE